MKKIGGNASCRKQKGGEHKEEERRTGLNKGVRVFQVNNSNKIKILIKIQNKDLNSNLQGLTYVN